MTQLGESGDRLGDYVCMDCTNLPYVVDVIKNHFAITKITGTVANLQVK